jgi:ribosome-binding factor A
MSQFRKERLESIMTQLLAGEIVKTLEQNGQLITVTGVTVDAKFERAKVHIEVFPDTQRQAALDELDRNEGKLRHFLLKHIPIKKIPHLVFE